MVNQNSGEKSGQNKNCGRWGENPEKLTAKNSQKDAPS